MVTEAETAPSKRTVAKHDLLGVDANGQIVVVENEEQATGIRYHHLDSGKTFDYIINGITAGTEAAMFAVFGAKTLATNEASAVRQKDETGDQVGAIQDRFSLIATGKWVDRTREGPKMNLDALAEAATQVLIETDNPAQPGTKLLDGNDAAAVGAKKASLREKLEDPKFVAQVRQVQGVAAKYAMLTGKASKTAADLAAMV